MRHEKYSAVVPASDGCFEETVLSRVVLDCGQVRFVVSGLPRTGAAAQGIFIAIARADVNVDLIVQGPPSGNRTTVSFTVAHEDQPRSLGAVATLIEASGGNVVLTPVAKLSICGAGLMSHGDTAAVLSAALAKSGTNIEMICTSELVVSVVVALDRANEAFDAVCAAFEFLDESVVAP